MAFHGWNSIGIMLPMLLMGDVFAVVWYQRHAQWGILLRLLPWILVGMAAGAVALHLLGQTDKTKALVDPIIGVLVLVMVALHLLQGRLGQHMTPKSKFGTAATGSAAGFATTISNAAGPIMSLFMAAQELNNEQFMGTIAWYFFSINLLKVPIFAFNHLFTRESLLISLLLFPIILLGAFLGKWMLPRFSEKQFTGLVVALAALGAISLFWQR